MNVRSEPKPAKRSIRARVAIWLLSILAVAIAGLTLMNSMSSPVGQWRSTQGRIEYETAYAEAMKGMPAFSKSYDLKTDYGIVRAYRWEVEETRHRTPIVLLPGRTSGAPMWGRNIPELMKQRPVYALDALGDSGMSVQTKKLSDDADQAIWLDQVLAGLLIDRAHLVGHSFGGWLAANYASRYPKRIVSLSLLEPVRTFIDMRVGIYLSSLPASLPFLPKSWRDGFLKKVGGAAQLDPRDPLTRMISAATDHFSPALPFPSMITAQQLQAWPMPVYVAMGADSALHDSAEAVRVAQSNIHDVTARNWPEGTHSLPMEKADEIDASMVKFMDRAETK